MIKKTCCFLAIGIMASLIMTSCGTKKEEVSESSEVETTEDETIDINAPYDDIISNVAYIEDGKSYHLLDLYGTQSVTKATPVVIEIHGGAFIGGEKEINASHSIYFAKSGYIVVTPDYIKVPEGSFTNAIQDLFAVYHWVEDNAEKYNFDLENIFLSGDSAGGYYTLLTNAIMSSQSHQDYFGVTPPSYNFIEYVTSCSATDILDFQVNPDSYLSKTIGKDLIFNNELMSHMDLYTNVDPEAFEGIYMMTSPDDSVTGSQVQKFEDYLNENNVEHTYVSYKGTENYLQHVFNILNPTYVESILANQEMVEYMDSLLK